MKIKFDIDKFVKYLDKFKSDLSKLYTWNSKIDKLVENKILTENQVSEINALSSEQKFYEKELLLKKIVGPKLVTAFKSKNDTFYKLCSWIVEDWGGIKTGNETAELINNFLNNEKPNFNRIASSSKVGAYMFPNKNVIYDSRVAYTLNWIILSENAGQKYFPIPNSRNTKMTAFDLNVLIRLKNISIYKTNDIKNLDNRLYINNIDKELFINKKYAYYELNNLVMQINKKLWKGDSEKEQNLFYTEMLLFSIANREVFMDITTRYGTI